MPQDKSHFHYGTFYYKVIDGKQGEARHIILDLTPEKSSVLDIGCGTGALCYALCEKKQCRVLGLDLSFKMIEFAQKHFAHPNASYVHGDATDLSDYGDFSFDFAVMMLFIHELEEEQQQKVLEEALRVAKKVIICDAASPLPNNKNSFLIWFAETVFGYDHKHHFKRFIAEAGIEGLLSKIGLSYQIEYSSLFWNKCRQVVVVSRQ
ncbi:MAG: class I SAM-dependent methyltransferase [Deltaproteobacteria bacterium]|nr:class I SAM-dependent methyltransferase [Deltaproteobacteria bacterium]